MAKAAAGAVIGQVRGRLGNEVAIQGRSGLVLRQPPTYKRPTQPDQQIVQTRMAQVMAAYNTLSHPQAMAWNTYAATLTRHNRVGENAYHPTGQNVFVGLASKFLQINPNGAVPLVPPSASFAGDSIVVGIGGGTGQVTFTASGPNSAPAQTELLIQPLKTPRRSPTLFYKSAAFVAFASGALSHAVPLAPGWVACAVRFVHPQTGQMTELVTLGVVEVA